jgi:hypothetical protein
MVCEPEELIKIPDTVRKIDARRVPILPNLKRRLAAYPVEVKCDKIPVVESSIRKSDYSNPIFLRLR